MYFNVTWINNQNQLGSILFDVTESNNSAFFAISFLTMLSHNICQVKKVLKDTNETLSWEYKKRFSKQLAFENILYRSVFRRRNEGNKILTTPHF